MLDALVGPQALVVAGVAAVAGGFYLAYTHSQTFHDDVNAMAGDLDGRVQAALWSTQQSLSLIDGQVTHLAADLKDGLAPQLQSTGDLLSKVGNISSPVTSTIGVLAGKVGNLQDHLGLAGTIATNAFLGPIGSIKTVLDLSNASMDAYNQHLRDMQLNLGQLAEKARVARLELSFQAQQQAQASYADPAAQSKDYEQGVTAEQESLKQAEEAYAEALGTGTGHLQLFAEEANAAAVAAKQDADNLATAKDEVARATHDWTTVVADEQTKLQTASDQSTARLVLALEHNSGNIDQLTAQAAADTRALQDQSKTRTEANKLIAKALGEETDAHGKIVPVLKDSRDAFTRLNDAVNKEATASLDRLSMAILTGRGDIEKLAAASAQSAEKQKKGDDAKLAAQILTAQKEGDFATVIDLTRQKLQKDLDDATGRLVADRRSGNTGAVGDDEARVKQTRDALDQFNRQVTAASKAGEVAAKSFSDLQQAADTRAKDALDRLALAIETGKGNIPELTAQAKSAAAQSDRFASALQQATNRITEWDQSLVNSLQHLGSGIVNAASAAGVDITKAQQAIKPPTFQSLQSQDQSAADKAMDAYERGLIAHLPAAELDKLKAAAVAASETLDHDTKVRTQAENAVARAIDGTTSSTVTFQGRLDDLNAAISKQIDTISSMILDGTAKNTAGQSSIARRALASEYGSEGQAPPQTTVLDAATTQLANDYEQLHRLTQIQAQAQMIAAQADGDFTTQLKLTTDKISTNLDQAVSKVTLDYYSHSGSITADDKALQHAATHKVQMDMAQAAAARQQLQDEANAALKLGDLSTAWTDLTKLANDDLSTSFSSLAAYFLTGKGNLAELTAEYQADAAEVAKQAEAERQAYIATGQYTKALQVTTGQINDGLSNALDGITLHFYEGDGNLSQLIASYQRAKAEQDAMTAATYRADLAVGDFKSALDILKNQISGNVDQAFAGLVLHFLNGTGSLSQLVAEYTRAQQAQANLDAATLKAYLVTGQFSQALSQLQNQISTRLNNALAGITLKFLTGQGNLAQLVDEYKKASIEQQLYTNATIKAQIAVGDFAGAFQTMQQQVDSAAQNAMQRLAYALLTGSGDVSQLAMEAAKAATASQKYADAVSEATIKELIASGQLYDAHMQELNGAAASTQAAYLNAVAAGVTGGALKQLYTAAVEAAAAVKQYAQVQEDIGVGADQLLGTPDFDIAGMPTSQYFTDLANQQQQALQDQQQQASQASTAASTANDTAQQQLQVLQQQLQTAQAQLAAVTEQRNDLRDLLALSRQVSRGNWEVGDSSGTILDDAGHQVAANISAR